MGVGEVVLESFAVHLGVWRVATEIRVMATMMGKFDAAVCAVLSVVGGSISLCVSETVLASGTEGFSGSEFRGCHLLLLYRKERNEIVSIGAQQLPQCQTRTNK